MANEEIIFRRNVSPESLVNTKISQDKVVSVDLFRGHGLLNESSLTHESIFISWPLLRVALALTSTDVVYYGLSMIPPIPPLLDPGTQLKSSSPFWSAEDHFYVSSSTTNTVL